MVDTYKINGTPVTKEQYDADQARFAAAKSNYINPSLSAIEAANKMTNPTVLGEPKTSTVPSYTPGGDAKRGYVNKPKAPSYTPGGDAKRGYRDTANVPPGAEPAKEAAATEVGFTSMDPKFDPRSPDLRVKIRVPKDYLVDLTSGSWATELTNHGGIIFPYTPSIDFEHKADYTTQTPTHNNYAINFYKNSSVSDITIQGKFTVENDQDAMVYLATVHLLRALTKMRFGPDTNAGAPPPVCRLDAYGDFMLKNIPVAITSFKNTLPDSVDFYTLDKSGFITGQNQYGTAFVPTLSTIAVTCKPMYSRAEMLGTGVNRYLGTALERKAGYL